jgi:transcriptional regulator with XRE-family HTH domain
VQQEFYSQSMAPVIAAPRIPAMPKKGPYLRKPKPPEKIRENSNFVRQWREWADMTQEELAEKSGLSVSSISAYEKEGGGNDPSVEALRKLSKALGVPAGMILDVNPAEDAPLWAGFLRASKDQKAEIGRIVSALVGPPKRAK